MRAPRNVLLPSALRRQLLAWGAESGEREACGVLVGELVGETLSIRRVVRAHNLALTDDAFVCDPGSIVAAERAARAERLALVGFWHTHQSGAAIPSSRDVDGAWPGTITAVVSLAHRPAVRLWRFAHETPIEIQLVASAACAVRLAAHNHHSAQIASTESP